MRFYRTASPEPRPQLLQLVHDNRVFGFGLLHASLEQFVSDGKSRIGMHAHDVYHIILYIEGENIFQLEDRDTPFTPGTLVLTGPHQRHHFYGFQPGAFAYKEVTFAFEHPKGDLDTPFHAMLSALVGAALPDCGSVFALTPAQTRECERLLDRVIGCFDRPHPLMWGEAHALMARLFAFLARTVYLPPMEHAAEKPDPLEQAYQQITHHYRERLTVGELATVAHLSEGYFLRAFRKAYGVTPIAYQIELRLQTARMLLTTTNLPVGEIARRVGFESPYYFSRLFRRAVGQSPRAFRCHQSGTQA